MAGCFRNVSERDMVLIKTIYFIYAMEPVNLDEDGDGKTCGVVGNGGPGRCLLAITVFRDFRPTNQEDSTGVLKNAISFRLMTKVPDNSVLPRRRYSKRNINYFYF